MSKLPSAHQIGDLVDLNFGVGGVMYDCQIFGVKFTPNKVFYDVKILIDIAYPCTIIDNVDSDFVNSQTILNDE